jgi:hypothetical protein
VKFRWDSREGGKVYTEMIYLYRGRRRRSRTQEGFLQLSAGAQTIVSGCNPGMEEVEVTKKAGDGEADEGESIG